MSGTRPAGCDLLERIAQQSDPEARVWRGSELPLHQQRVTILGTPLGHPDFISAQLQQKIQDHKILLERIPAVTDVQSAWSLLLHCPQHGQGIWQCCCEILGVSSVDVSAITRDTATLPLALGGLGLRSATRTSLSAFWSSWADCLSMIHKRHPTVAENLVRELEGDRDVPLSKWLLMQPGFCPVCLDSSCPVGLHWCTAPDLLSVNLKIMSRVLHAAGGSMRQASTQNWHSGAECWRCWLIMRRPSCVPRVA